MQMLVPGFWRVLIRLSLVGLITNCSIGRSYTQDGQYSESKCQESADCRRLKNEQPDFQLEAQVLEVIDGDTIRVKSYLLPGLFYEVLVRARGIDAPEIRNFKCEREQEFGIKARETISRKFRPGTWVILRDVGEDSFGGRIVAQIDRWTSDRFTSLSEELLRMEEVLAVPYVKGEEYDWCKGS